MGWPTTDDDSERNTLQMDDQFGKRAFAGASALKSQSSFEMSSAGSVAFAVASLIPLISGMLAYL